MSLPLKKSMRKKAPVRRRAPRRRAFRPARSVADYAGASENQTINPAVGGNFTSGVCYQVRDTNLNQFPRCSAIAAGYQHYKIKRITLIVKPSYDTFQQAVGGPGKMRLYYMIDKSGSIPENPTLEALKQMGAKPINLDEKPIKISWRPSVLTAASNGLDPRSSRYTISPWLSTNRTTLEGPPGTTWAPSQIAHLGVFFYVDQVFLSGTQFQCELNVEFQFKKPLVKFAPEAAAAVGIKPAVLDASPDGVVGGNDAPVVT